jgi:hypothetical protein
MKIEYDPAKDEANRAKHGISLGRARDMQVLAYLEDDRFEEPRFRLYGLIDDKPYCLAGTMRQGAVRVISLRRAHAAEMERYAQSR